MVWKGSLNTEGLEDKSLLNLVTITESRDNLVDIEVKKEKKDEFVQKAIKSIKQGYYIHIVKDKVMYVIFKNHMFKFSRGYPELETARKYGKSQGISEKEMSFEKLIEKPWRFDKKLRKGLN